VWREATIHFVDGENGIDINDVVNDFMNPMVNFDVAGMVRFDELDAGAEVAGFADGSPGFDAVPLGFVAGGDTASRLDSERGHYADGLPAELRAELLLDRGKKTVEVDE